MRHDVLRPYLAAEHAQWLDEVTEVLAAAQQPEAGAWARWSALRYLQTTFPHRLAEERRLVESVAARLSEEQRATLWALGELLDALRSQLDHLIGLCHRADEFSTITRKLVTALQHWCRAVEVDVGPVRWSAVPTELREALDGAIAEPAAAV
jgi:hypothetical protein